MAWIHELLLTPILTLSVAGACYAQPGWLTKARKLGFEHINSCMSCHTNEPNKKSEKGGVAFNERGEWLLKLKNEHNAKNDAAKIIVKLEWLKEDPFKDKEPDRVDE
ncbi:MAG: hypothetical protein LBB40_02420 [Holophagales bacterium]|jgi:hypothetical protein|nr:hypothetical protein [Holophagales bacterium]